MWYRSYIVRSPFLWKSYHSTYIVLVLTYMCIFYALQDPLSYNFGIQLSSCIAMISSQYTSLNELLSEYLNKILVTMTTVIWYLTSICLGFLTSMCFQIICKVNLPCRAAPRFIHKTVFLLALIISVNFINMYWMVFYFHLWYIVYTAMK